VWFGLVAQMTAAGTPIEPQVAQAATKAKSIPPPEDRVDINHASVAALLKVPGMTPSWAGRIVRFRPYRTKQDLLDRGVLPGDVYDRIKDYVIAHREKQ
jgi:competence protein ComEA